MSVRALRFSRAGGPEVLALETVELPEPGPGQVRLDVKAAGLNPYDAKLRSGAYGAIDGPRPVGAEVAGVVTAVGPDAGVRVGDAVFGPAAGGTSGVATAAVAGPVAIKPTDMPWADAAGWPVVGETAIRCLRELDVVAGDVLLVHGGAGSVGRFAVQLALRANAQVIATAAERDHDDLRALGAIPVTYGAGWADRVRAALRAAMADGAAADADDGAADHGGAGAAQGGVTDDDDAGAGAADSGAGATDDGGAADSAEGRVVDAVLDAAGAGVLAESVVLAGGPERVLTIAGDDAEAAGVPFSGGSSAEDRRAAVLALPDLWAAGVRIPVGATFPLERAAAAYAALDAHEPRGKLVVTT